MKTAFLLLGALPLLAQSDQKSSVRGRVIDDIYAQGTTKARVALTGGTLSSPLVAESDEHGNFAFSAVAAGRYQLNIEKAGYTTPPPQSVQVGASANVDLGDIVLIQSRFISGKVQWSDGEPAVDVTVQILPVVGGKPTYRGVATYYSTDARGSYRTRPLQPGRYIAFATSASASISEDARPRVAKPVFYSGSEFMAGSTFIDLRKTPEASDISFKLQDRPGVTVEGTVLPSGSFPKGSQIGIGLALVGVPTPWYGVTDMHVGETFRFLDIPEGQYTVIVSSRPELYRGYESVQVRTEPISNIQVHMPELVPVKMRVEREESDGSKTSRVAGLVIRAHFDTLQQYGNVNINSTRSNPSIDNGDVTVNSISPGATYKMDFNTVPAETYVASVTQGTHEQLFGPFEFVANSELIHVLLKKDGGTITGSVHGDKGPVPQAFVVLAPKMRKATNRFLTASADKDGNYKIGAIAPGDYELYAFDRNDEDSYLDDDYLRKYNSRVIAVAIQPNSAVSLQPELTKVAGQ